MKISIIIPVYNVAPYIEDCLRSVMRQTYEGQMECIIVDDCGTDDSMAIAERMVSLYEGTIRFVILHHTHNRGLSAARNTGTEAAKGDYIYYLDSDDEITTDCMEKLIKPILNDNTIEMVMGDFKEDFDAMPESWTRKNHNLRYKEWMENSPMELKSNDEIRRWFYKGKTPIPVGAWNRLVNHAFIKKYQLYNKEGMIHEEHLLTFYMMRCLNHIAFVHDVTYLYHRRPDSICMGTPHDENLQHYGVFYKEIADNVVHGERIEEIEHEFSAFCRHYMGASDNPNFQYAYRVFRRELNDGHHVLHICLLSLIHFLCSHKEGKQLLKFGRKILKSAICQRDRSVASI